MTFSDKLNLLNMSPLTSGLLLVSDKDNLQITETERRILNIAEKDYNADAVYFRKFDSQHSPIPQIFIYDNSDNHLQDNDKKEIHKRIWSSEIVPVYYIFEKTQLFIINGKQKIAIINSNENFEKTVTDNLDLIKDIEHNYDALKHPYKGYFFDNGSFWDTNVYLNKFISKESPFDILINYLKELKKNIKNNVSECVSNRLIVQCILVKYLEEKKDKNGKNVFTVKTNIFNENWQAEDFVDVIKKGKLLNLFDYLAGYYNGKVFEWNKIDEINEREELSSLSQEVLEYIAAYFNGNFNFKTNLFALWRYYSFQYLPVELISRIYEEFLPDMSGVVYTPPFLVDFLVDECMPIEDYKKFKNGKFKILDPSMGSGIFCVAAYKRLIDWYKINRYYSERISWFESIDSEKLKELLRDNIFGTDVEKEAIRIAIFSLTLALLENLTPLQILEDLKFDDLSKENIICDNFFNFFNQHKENPDFDLVIGNPPFNPPNNISNGAYMKILKNDYHIDVSNKIRDYNLALVFLDQATQLSKPNGNGLTCLILPSAPLLYGKWSMEFRSHFLQSYFVPQIIDFTHLRRILFNKEIAVAAIFVKNQKPNLKDNIWHIIASRTKKEQNRLFFLFDHYDFHLINYQRALDEKYIWKANLVGGGRLGRIVERLDDIKPKLGEYIESKRSEGWQYGEGYIKGELKDKTAEQIEKQFSKAEWLYNKPSIKTNSFNEDGTFETETDSERELFMSSSKKNKNIFLSPHIIIHESLGKNNIPIAFIDDGKDLIFNHRFIGIYAPTNSNLLEIYNYLKSKNNKENRLFAILASGELLIKKEKVIIKEDIDNLPYPEDETELELSEIEKVWQDDVLNYYIHQAKSPNTNPLNKNIENAKIQIKEYGEIFCMVMNASYKYKSGFSFKQGESYETNSYIATCFHYTDKEILYSFSKINEEKFKDYFNKQTGKNQQINRIVKFVQDDIIWFIKPLQLRYWLKSIADRDAMDCFNDILMNKEA